MSHRHAFRRGVTPRPSEKDLRVWGRLLKRASVIREGCSPDQTQAFVTAACKAGGAIMPVGHQGRESAFATLVRLGKGWFKPRSTEDRRRDEAEISRLTTVCLAVLDAPAAEPVRRERKDIDG